MVQLEKKLSAEQELLLQQIETLERNKTDVKLRLDRAKELLNKTPWDAERAKDVEDLEHLLAVIEFKLQTLREKLE